MERYIASIMEKEYGMNEEQCSNRWKNWLSPNARYKKFTSEEDKKLIELVETHGKNWNQIAAEMPGKKPRQCKERWENCLRPDINRGPFTPGEDKIVIEKHAEFGNNWDKIAQLLPGRTPNIVKNRWLNYLRKQNQMPVPVQQIPPNQVSPATTFDPTSVESLLNRPVFLSNSVKNHAIGEPEPPLDINQFLRSFFGHSK